jgi:hypothetical protein
MFQQFNCNPLWHCAVTQVSAWCRPRDLAPRPGPATRPSDPAPRPGSATRPGAGPLGRGEGGREWGGLIERGDRWGSLPAIVLRGGPPEASPYAVDWVESRRRWWRCWWVCASRGFMHIQISISQALPPINALRPAATYGLGTDQDLDCNFSSWPGNWIIIVAICCNLIEHLLHLQPDWTLASSPKIFVAVDSAENDLSWWLAHGRSVVAAWA